MRHRRQRQNQARRPTHLRVLATTTTAARLGPKLPANISSVASQGSCGLTAGDKPQQAQDQAKVSTK
jgi:hypothetical protein